MASMEGVQFDKTLMQDWFTGSDSGTTFDGIKNWVSTNQIEEGLAGDDDDSYQSIIDEKKQSAVKIPSFKSKIAMMAWQMLKARFEDAGSPVVLHFYDDSESVLNGLDRFFNAHKDLMPAGVTLRLHRVTVAAQRDEADNAVFEVNLENRCSITSAQRGGFELSQVDFVSQQACLRNALGFVADHVGSSDLDGSEELFSRALPAMLGQGEVADSLDGLDSLVKRYETERKGELPTEGDIENHRVKGGSGGCTYGEKIAACAALKYFLRSPTQASGDFLLRHMRALSNGRLGRRIAEDMRAQLNDDNAPRGCLVSLFRPRPSTVIRLWVQQQVQETLAAAQTESCSQ
jgi:hypothetical protein